MKSIITFLFSLLISFSFGQGHQLEKEYFFNKQISESQLIDSLTHKHKNQYLKINFEKMKSKNDRSSNKHSKYIQTINHLKVNNAIIVLHSKNGIVKKKSGHHYSGSSIVDSHLIDEKIASQSAKVHFVDFVKENFSDIIIDSDIAVGNVEKTYSDKNYPDFTDVLLPTYNVELGHPLKNIQVKMIIDAITGLVLFTEQKIKHQNVPGKGVSNYYGNVDINLDSITPNRIVFQDNTRDAPITVNDFYSNEVVETNQSTVNFDDPWKNAAIDVLFGTGKFYDFMKEKFDFNSLDDNNIPLVANVGKLLYNNAYWNGKSTNYGSGDCLKYSPFTSIDIVGHEFAHGITDYSSNLIYQGESGALNESFSDIIGKALERWTFPENFSWVMGEPIFRGASPFRTMNAPYQHNHPSVYKGTNWVNLVFLSFGVHTNSAISNLWFTMLSDGNKGSNEHGWVYDVKPIGMDRALDIVFHTHQHYLTPSSGYFDMYQYSLEAADDLFPDDQAIRNSILEAWKAVGITPEVFNTESENASFQISVNGGSSGMRICDRKIKQINLDLKYLGKQEIPANTPINILIHINYAKISNGSFNQVNDTIFDSVYLPSTNIKSGEKISLLIDNTTNFDSLLFGINFSSTISYHSQNENVRYETNYFTVHITNTNLEPKDIFRPGSQRSVIPKDVCNPSLGVSYVSYDIIGNICDSSSIPFKILIKDGQEAHEFTYYANTTSSSSLLITNIQNYFSVSGVKNVDRAIVEIYSIVNNEDYLEISDTLSRYFGKYLTLNEKVTFDDNLDHPSVTIDECLFCDKNILGQLTIKTNVYESILDDCVEPEVYFALKSDSRYNLSTVKVCIDAGTGENVTLNFNTRFSTSNEYNNYLKLHDGNAYLPDIAIYDTDNTMKSYSIPIQNKGKFGLSLKCLMYNTSWMLDNISLQKTSSTTENSALSDSMTSNNPVDDFLRIKVKEEFIGCQIEMIKMTGEVFYAANIRNIDLEIPVNNWPSGIYIAHIHGKSGYITKKIVVSH